MDTENKTLYTAEGYKALTDELDNLINVQRPANKAALKEARAFGDFSENSELDEAKDEQAKIEARISELEYLINHAEVVADDQIKKGVVNLGTVVKVHDEIKNKDKEYTIVGSNEADPFAGKISDQSPIGRGLLGCKKGDVVDITTPAAELKFRILDVQRAK